MGHSWDLTFDPANLRAMSAVSDAEWDMEIRASQLLPSPVRRLRWGSMFSRNPYFREFPAHHLPLPPPTEQQRQAELASGIAGGVLEEGRTFLTILTTLHDRLVEENVHSHYAGARALSSISSNSFPTSGITTEEEVSCKLNAMEHSSAHMRKALTCLLIWHPGGRCIVSCDH